MILNSPTISGSLTVTGNILTSGSITLSGSVASASFASTASFVALAQSASNAVSAATASFANSFTVAGNLTAQTLVVQTITSSVDFVTGSTRFGSIAANTHTFTGSVNVSGSGNFLSSVTANNFIATSTGNANVFNAASATTGWMQVAMNNTNGSAILGIEGDTAGTTTNGSLAYATILRNYTNTALQIATNNIVRATITSGGNVGIGTTTPGQLLEVVGGEIKAGRVDSSNEGGQVSFGRSTDNATAWYIDAYGNVASPQLRFVNVTNAVVAMTLTGSNVGIGVDNPTFPASRNGMTMKAPTTNGTEFVMLSSTDTGFIGGCLVRNGADFGVINRTSGNLIFATNAVERMYITSVGNLEMRPITFSGVANNATQTVLSNMGKGTWLVSVANDIDSSDGYSAMLWVRTNEIIQMQVFRVDSMVFSYTNQDLRIQNTSGFTATLYVTAIRMAAS